MVYKFVNRLLTETNIKKINKKHPAILEEFATHFVVLDQTIICGKFIDACWYRKCMYIVPLVD